MQYVGSSFLTRDRGPPLLWECKVLTTGPPGMFPLIFLTFTSHLQGRYYYYFPFLQRDTETLSTLYKVTQFLSGEPRN